MTELDASIRQLPGLLVNEAINIFSFKKKKRANEICLARRNTARARCVLVE